MTFVMFLRTVFEILLFAGVVWGIFHEDRLAAFERRVICAVKRRRLKLVVRSARVEPVTPEI